MDRQDQAAEYLEEHGVLDLFNNMTAQLVYNQPADPKAFLSQYLDTLIERRNGKEVEAPVANFFDAENARAVFRTFDASSRGFLTLDQYHAAMGSLLLHNYNREPKGFVEGRILPNTFVEECELACQNIL
ncbi:uncharacterized protein MONBRDRAFT_33294 [Monosiga brevicollis MX1]|uniref:EF-hand domain-containing protein n=1 Tax=Monosiga brevicollis TaxID=81824 RepID=A9V4L1_MONBE|nr:uncharacterized protein MONBRDRAFT_33294 [Monosiga brevicollis MX1]EDQ87473.1 predicted protein [Monosiga brevicollis MX1]|eukprot:XP_001747733.1 hypothetical protein [Monosiga brevicollis MX1]